MNILTINYSDRTGGAACAASRLNKALRLYDIGTVTLVKTKCSDIANVYGEDDLLKKDKWNQITRYLNIKIKNKSQQLRWNKYIIREDAYLSDLRSDFPANALSYFNFDILHLHWVNERFFNLKELKNTDKPIVWTLHDSWPFTGICHYFYDCENYTKTCGLCPFLNSLDKKDLSNKVWKKKKEIYSSLRLNIVAPSNWIAEAARKSALFSGFPVTVIPNGIDTALFSPGERINACMALDLNPDKKYLLFSAMKVFSDRNKGFAELLDTLSLVNQTFNCNNLELLVIGSSKIHEAIDLPFPVRFLGMINSDRKMVMAYRLAEVTIVPSYSENLSNTIMESLSCGTPVVAFNIGGNSDLIDHQENGYLAIQGSCKDLANGILWCLDNNNDNKLSDMARKKITNSFAVEKTSSEYYNLYNSLIN